ncbi:MAG: SgcJ/EcaC family oxidoreductase [Pseudomonadota bacterium]
METHLKRDHVIYPDGEAVARAFFEHWNAGDADTIGELFVDDADFVNVVGFWWRKRSQIRKAHEYGFRKIFSNSVIEITEFKVRALTDDIHVVHTVSTLDGQTPIDGEPTQTRIAVISMVAVRQSEGGFRIVSCQNTDRVEGVDTHVRTAQSFKPASYSASAL